MERLAQGPARACRALLVTCLLLGLLPGASAEAGRFASAHIALTPQVFTAELVGETREGDDASNLRRIIDEDHGDADGTVTADEVDAYRTATMANFNAQLSNPFAAGLVSEIQVNDRPPMRVRVTDIQLSANVLGDITANSTLYRDVSAEMTFASTSRDRASVSIGDDFRKAFPTLEWGHAVFTGAGDWAIDADSIAPARVKDTFWTGDGFNVTYDETPQFASAFDPLTFELSNTTASGEKGKGAKKDSPGLPALLVPVLVGLVAVVLRRRAA